MSLLHPKTWLTELGVAMSRPAAFVLYLAYGACWIAFGHGLDWHSVATFLTWGMTLLIQRAEHRDTQALHAKLDELLKVHGDAENSLMNIDERDTEDVERKRAEIQEKPR